MSLIQEALTRKLEEQNNPTQNSMPAAGLAPRSSGPSRGGAFGRILGFVVAIVLLLGVAVSLFYLAARNWNWKDALAEAKSDAGHARSKWEQSLEKNQKAGAEKEGIREVSAAASSGASLTPQPLLAVKARVGDMKGKVVAYNADNAEIVSGAPAPVAAMASAAPESPAAAPSLAPQKPVQETARTGRGVSWPRITVNGILSSGKQGAGSAMINNRMVSANETVENARVLEVQSRGVMMEFKGETRLLLIGQTAD